MKEIIIKKTAQHVEGQKYLERAMEGSIPAPVFLSERNGKVEASIDGDPIGFVKEMKPEEIPVSYSCKVVGLGDSPATFKAELNVEVSAGKEKAETDASAFEKEIKIAVKKSNLTKKEVEERVNVMIANNVTPSVIRVTLSDYHKVEKPHVPSAIYQNMRGDKENSILNLALMAAHNGQALIFSGEKSTGKNVAAETVAYCRGESFYRINFQKNMMIEDIFGSQTTDNSAAERLEVEKAKALLKLKAHPNEMTDEEIELAAEFEVDKAKSACIRLIHSKSDIIRWAEEGGVMLYDEVNMANANILQQVMNSVADGEKVLIVPGVGNIKLNKNCVLLAGMNPGYAGTMELNHATKSRCGFINFEYPNSVVEQLKANFAEGEVADAYYNACEKFYKKMKKAVEAHFIDSTYCLNIRGFVNALKNVATFPDATTLKEELITYVVSGCEEGKERDSVMEILEQQIGNL